MIAILSSTGYTWQPQSTPIIDPCPKHLAGCRCWCDRCIRTKAPHRPHALRVGENVNKLSYEAMYFIYLIYLSGNI